MSAQHEASLNKRKRRIIGFQAAMLIWALIGMCIIPLSGLTLMFFLSIPYGVPFVIAVWVGAVIFRIVVTVYFKLTGQL